MDRLTKIGVWFLWTLSLAALAVGCGDPLPPDTPHNLVVNATSASTIDISWDASTGRQEIEKYRIFRDGSFYAATNTTVYNDTGLTNSTEYCYRVQAVDVDGERSDKSERVCDTTFPKDDTQNPTAPSNLTATVINSTQIDLAWDESTDDVGIDHYEVFRDVDGLIASPIINSYSNIGLTNSTKYCYIVNAVDLSGKKSSPSNQACKTTDP